ncbi:hypothetical protein [Arenivirga flava]|uniref:Uncharacterized protein n=1 Tax=Arenivirga flava TaxID=1930060 RepID=A0AA37XDL3_9MICO|nr:hypothetical protein [Arenivirga flava]GMA26798.1 hypothetical protein GCM10025874_00510 [Arenivirga flava]GMA29914.1 hypothetical protein GCM10025874_31670 [Arenivirga flava]GMA29957.1 hypothetical protein GCM10025874_32100 [Arenivirga flava]
MLVLVAASVAVARQGKDSGSNWATKGLALIGASLFIWTSVSFVTQPPDWADVMQSLFYGFWLPLSLFPFFYWFGYSVVLQEVTTRISIRGTKLTRRNVTGLALGSQGRLSILQRYRPRHDEFARDGTLRGSLLGMREVRADIRKTAQAEADRLAALERNVGRNERDADGRHLDRREFRETKEQLEWLWVLQNGQYERRGSQYWDDVPDVLIDAAAHGLPANHGVHIETADAFKVWRAWRITPGGGVLGIGGSEHRSKFVFQGDAPPTSWPGEGEEWSAGFIRKRWPPDWKQSDDPIL